VIPYGVVDRESKRQHHDQRDSNPASHLLGASHPLMLDVKPGRVQASFAETWDAELRSGCGRLASRSSVRGTAGELVEAPAAMVW
jgi:hypothetical protein